MGNADIDTNARVLKIEDRDSINIVARVLDIEDRDSVAIVIVGPHWRANVATIHDLAIFVVATIGYPANNAQQRVSIGETAPTPTTVKTL